MRRDDEIRIRHMLDSAHEATSFVQGHTRQSLDVNRQLALALVREIEIIGEATTKISLETRQAFPEIPWSNIIAMRNRLIHAYFEIDLDRVWDTVIEDLPPLVTALEKILPSRTS